MDCAEATARAFHECYERRAPVHGWETQERSRKAWDDVPEENRSLMIAVAQELLDDGVIRCGHDHE
jgi:hypothetical protein